MENAFILYSLEPARGACIECGLFAAEMLRPRLQILAKIYCMPPALGPRSLRAIFRPDVNYLLFAKWLRVARIKDCRLKLRGSTRAQGSKGKIGNSPF